MVTLLHTLVCAKSNQVAEVIGSSCWALVPMVLVFEEPYGKPFFVYRIYLWFFVSHRYITSFALCPGEIIAVDIVLSEEKIRRHNSPGPSFNYFLKKLLERFVFEASHHLGFLDMPFSWGHILVRSVSFRSFHRLELQHLNMCSEYAFASCDWFYTQESWVCCCCLWTAWGLRCLTRDWSQRLCRRDGLHLVLHREVFHLCSLPCPILL